MFIQPHLNTRRVGRILENYANPRMTVSNSHNPPRVYMRLHKHGKSALLLNLLPDRITELDIIIKRAILSKKNM